MINESRPLFMTADNVTIAKENRIRIQGKACMTLIPDTFFVDVFNLSDDDLDRIRRAKIVTVAGRDDSVISYGEVEDIIKTSDGTNEITTIVIVDGKSLRDTVVYQALGAGATVRTTLATLLGASVLGTYLAPEVRLTRGQTFSGRLLAAVRTLAKSAGARAFLMHNQVHVITKRATISETRIPAAEIEDDPQYAEGTCILRTVVKGYAVGTIVVLNGRKYRLVSQTVDADNLKGTWRSELVLMDEDMLDADGMEGG